MDDSKSTDSEATGSLQTNGRRVLVLMGGPDAEHDVSIKSGRAVANALRESGQFTVIERTIDTATIEDLLTDAPDAIFPVLHGPWGEGGPLQCLLEEIQHNHGIGYVGSGPESASLCMNKFDAKQMIKQQTNVPTPPAALFNPSATTACPLPPPVVLKPVDDGSSVDVFLCHTQQDVEHATRHFVIQGRESVMAEQLIAGREITVSVLFGRPLPLIEIIPNVSFYDFDAKYERDDTRYVINPLLDMSSGCVMNKVGAAHLSMVESIQRAACETYQTLGCRDLARVDFMVDARGLWLLEVNTMPGFTSHSLLPMAAQAEGLNMADLCTALVNATLARCPASISSASSRH